MGFSERDHFGRHGPQGHSVGTSQAKIRCQKEEVVRVTMELVVYMTKQPSALWEEGVRRGLTC